MPLTPRQVKILAALITHDSSRGHSVFETSRLLGDDSSPDQDFIALKELVELDYVEKRHEYYGSWPSGRAGAVSDASVLNERLMYRATSAGRTAHAQAMGTEL